MADKMQKQEWVEEAITSLQDMSRANAPADLYEKVIVGINRHSARIVPIPMKQWAAAALLLLALNI